MFLLFYPQFQLAIYTRTKPPFCLVSCKKLSRFFSFLSLGAILCHVFVFHRKFLVMALYFLTVLSNPTSLIQDFGSGIQLMKCGSYPLESRIEAAGIQFVTKVVDCEQSLYYLRYKKSPTNLTSAIQRERQENYYRYGGGEYAGNVLFFDALPPY